MQRRFLKDESFSDNNLCRETGKHSWESTTAPNFRRCSRSGCKAAQRLHNGAWVDVEHKKPVRRTRQTVLERSTLFDPCEPVSFVDATIRNTSLHDYWSN